MASGLHHHHLRLAESRYLLCRMPFLRTRYSAAPSKRGLLQLTPRFIQCVKQEEQAYSDGEAIEWVNKAARDPMVELDPVTVFRRIVVERRASASASASLALARAKAKVDLQTTSPPPFILGSKWPGKSAIAIITALFLLSVAAALYFLRSRKGRDDATELTSADTKDTVETSIDGRRKLVKDTIKAPESILTAMALGAASVSRPKGHIGSTHDTLHASNGNVVESQRPEGAIDFYSIGNTVAVEDMESDSPGKLMFGQTPYSSSMVEDFACLKVENVGVDVTEGPWFGQGVSDTGTLVPAEVDSEMSYLPVLEQLESGKPVELEAGDLHIESQTSPLLNETIAQPSAEQFVSESSVSEVDGELHGEVVAVSELPNNHSTVPVLEFKLEESQIDGILAESSITIEQLEQVIEEDLIPPLEGEGAADDTTSPEQNIVVGSSALALSNEQFDDIDSESDDEDADNIRHHEAEQSFTSKMSLEANDSKSGVKEVPVADGYVLGLNSDSLSIKELENTANLLSGVDQTLEGIETELDDVLDDESLSTYAFRMDQIEEGEAFKYDTGKESLTDNRAAVQASEEDSREDSKKALEAAVPAIAIGVGTVGALFGVAGGLQVVGFAALASFLSHDFLWAQSRESLWQELNSITDRQKLLDFLVKRNITRTKQEKSSL